MLKVVGIALKPQRCQIADPALDRFGRISSVNPPSSITESVDNPQCNGETLLLSSFLGGSDNETI